MARKVSVEDLTNDGVEETEAKRIVAKLNKPKPRVITWIFKCTEKEVVKVAKAFPQFQFEKRYKPREKK